MTTIKSPLSVELVQQFIPFDELTATTIERLLPHFRYYEIPARQLIFKRGQADAECHFLLQGMIDLVDERFEITKLSGSDVENCLALDASHNIHRQAAVTQTACKLFAVKREHLDLITTWAELSNAWHDNAAQSDNDSDWLETLLTSNLFSRVPAANIQKLIAAFNEKPVKLGEVVIKQGDDGDECYVLKEGNALVTQTEGNKETVLAALAPGNLFGEDALISNMSRNATITMSSDGVLMTINKDDFNVLLKQPVIDYINDSELATLITEGDTGTILLDVRFAQEAALQPMQRARNIPLAQLRSKLAELSKEFIYVIIGEARAEAAAYILNEAGFSAKVLKTE